MKFFVDSLDRKIWDVITNNAFIHLLENNVVLSKNERDHLACVAKNIIVSAFDSDELLKVSECISAKEMGDTLERIHKDSRSAWLDSDESSPGSSSADSKICLSDGKRRVCIKQCKYILLGLIVPKFKRGGELTF